jgi:hypothetical protein
MKLHSPRMTFGVLIFAIFAMSVPHARAELTGEQKALFEAIPADPWAVLAVPSMKNLDARVALVGQKLGMPVPAPMMMMAGQLGVLDVLDTSRGAAFVVLDFAKYGFPQGVVSIMPATDPDAFLKALAVPEETGVDEPSDETQAAEGEDPARGLVRCTIMGQQVYGGKKGKYVVLSMSAPACRATIDAKETFTKSLQKERVENFAKADVILSVSAVRWFGQFGIQAKGMAQMVTMMAGPQAGQVSTAIDEFFKILGDLDTLDMCAVISEKGFSLSWMVTPKSGSELSTTFKDIKPQTASLLAGLPQEKFCLAFGSVGGPTQSTEKMTKDAEQQIDGLLKAFQLHELVDAKKVKPVVADYVALLQMIGHQAVSISVLPKGSDGVLGASILLKVKDSGKAIETVRKIIKGLREISEDEEIRLYTSMLDCKSEAETIDGTAVDHLTIELSKLVDEGEMEQEDLDSIGKVFGKDGMLIRMAPVGSDAYLLTIGGGKTRFETSLKAARSSSGGLAEDRSIRQVTTNLPARKSSEIYLAVDAIVELIQNTMSALGEKDELPLKLTDINAPVAMATTIEGASGRFDLFVPMELVTSIKNAWMASMAGDNDWDVDDDEDEDEDDDEDY